MAWRPAVWNPGLLWPGHLRPPLVLAAPPIGRVPYSFLPSRAARLGRGPGDAASDRGGEGFQDGTDRSRQGTGDGGGVVHGQAPHARGETARGEAFARRRRASRAGRVGGVRHPGRPPGQVRHARAPPPDIRVLHRLVGGPGVVAAPADRRRGRHRGLRLRDRRVDGLAGIRPAGDAGPVRGGQVRHGPARLGRGRGGGPVLPGGVDGRPARHRSRTSGLRLPRGVRPAAARRAGQAGVAAPGDLPQEAGRTRRGDRTGRAPPHLPRAARRGRPQHQHDADPDGGGAHDHGPRSRRGRGRPAQRRARRAGGDGGDAAVAARAARRPGGRPGRPEGRPRGRRLPHRRGNRLPRGGGSARWNGLSREDRFHRWDGLSRPQGRGPALADRPGPRGGSARRCRRAPDTPGCRS